VTRPEDRREIRDVRALAALAHPVRSALLSHLMAVGPRTASECAPAVGASASNCSWHLRHLARFGLVERDEGSDDGRERPWRAAATGFHFGGEPAADDPATQAAQQALLSVQLDEEARLARAHLRGVDELPAAWRETSAFNTYGLLLTPAELRELVERLDALVRPYIRMTRDDAPADARPVHLGIRAFRFPEQS
jgi:DNA-binding transcriptional ArsR family regulator